MNTHTDIYTHTHKNYMARCSGLTIHSKSARLAPTFKESVAMGLSAGAHCGPHNIAIECSVKMGKLRVMSSAHTSVIRIFVIFVPCSGALGLPPPE